MHLVNEYEIDWGWEPRKADKTCTTQYEFRLTARESKVEYSIYP